MGRGAVAATVATVQVRLARHTNRLANPYRDRSG